MADPIATTAGPESKDRKTGLLVFGILGIIVGGLCAIGAVLMAFATIAYHMAAQGNSDLPMTARTLIPGLLVYALLAVWFIWMGVGSIMARRWARALILVSSWLWLISGIAVFAFSLISMMNVYDQMAQQGAMSDTVVRVMRTSSLCFIFLFCVIVPGALVLFYGSRHVKATCERRDPKVRWTDKCPLPVLAVSLVFGLWACWMPLMGFYGWVVPLFGTIASGMMGAAALLACMVLCGYVAWGTYRLKTPAWWTALLLVILWSISSVVTFSRLDLMDLYEKMGYPPRQFEMMGSSMPSQFSLLVAIGLWQIAALGYLIYVRKFFGRTAPAEN